MRKVRINKQRPKLVVFRSAKFISGQVIDTDGKVIASVAPSKQPENAGKTIATKCKRAGVRSIRFARGKYKFHGRVKNFAEGARAGGLEF